MANKRLLTLDDLCDYYSDHKNMVTYSVGRNSNCPVAVQIEASLTFDEDDYDPELGLLKTHLNSCHIGTNRNKSTIEREIMEEAKISIYNRPILGFIHKLSDGTYDFAGHEMFINEDGEIEYEEIPVGCIPESGNAHLEYDKENDKTYLCVDGVIFEEYTRAAQILKEKKSCKVSVELSLLDFSYNPKEKLMVINKFYFSGITILGRDRHTEQLLEEGMLGSKITLKDFKKNNSMFSNREKWDSKLIETLEKLNNTLSNININQTEMTVEKESKEGGVEGMTKFEELLEKYGKTEADIEFETEVLSDEELEAKFEEVFGEENEPETKSAIDTVDSVENTATQDAYSLVERTFEIDGKKFSVSFELSHDDIRFGLYNLLAEYDSIDNDWYYIREVYDDRFIFQGCCTGKIYGQKYVKDGNTVSFDGERWELFEELLTASEKAELELMRTNYSSIKTELDAYKAAESYADKMTVFEDESYAQFLETPEFKDLMSKETVNKYTKEELEDKANITFSKLVKKNKTFTLEKPETETKPFKAGFVFGKIEQRASFLDNLLKEKK